MITYSELHGLRGKGVSCRYDMQSNCVDLEFGRFYEDPEEADFFGDHIDEGLPSGFRFEGTSDYSSSNGEDLQLGRVEAIEIKDGACDLEIIGPVPDQSGRVSFSFRKIVQILSARARKMPNQPPEPTSGLGPGRGPA